LFRGHCDEKSNVSEKEAALVFAPANNERSTHVAGVCSDIATFAESSFVREFPGPTAEKEKTALERAAIDGFVTEDPMKTSLRLNADELVRVTSEGGERKDLVGIKSLDPDKELLSPRTGDGEKHVESFIPSGSPLVPSAFDSETSVDNS
jgi:hypothetical protein